MAYAQSRHASPEVLAVTHEPWVKQFMQDRIVDDEVRGTYELPFKEIFCFFEQLPHTVF